MTLTRTVLSARATSYPPALDRALTLLGLAVEVAEVPEREPFDFAERPAEGDSPIEDKASCSGRFASSDQLGVLPERLYSITNIASRSVPGRLPASCSIVIPDSRSASSISPSVIDSRSSVLSSVI